MSLDRYELYILKTNPKASVNCSDSIHSFVSTQVASAFHYSDSRLWLLMPNTLIFFGTQTVIFLVHSSNLANLREIPQIKPTHFFYQRPIFWLPNMILLRSRLITFVNFPIWRPKVNPGFHPEVLHDIRSLNVKRCWKSNKRMIIIR